MLQTSPPVKSWLVYACLKPKYSNINKLRASIEYISLYRWQCSGTSTWYKHVVRYLLWDNDAELLIDPPQEGVGLRGGVTYQVKVVQVQGPYHDPAVVLLLDVLNLQPTKDVQQSRWPGEEAALIFEKTIVSFCYIFILNLLAGCNWQLFICKFCKFKAFINDKVCTAVCSVR